jgi:transposase
MSQSKQYVGLDVSLKETSICVIDDADKIVWRGQVDSTPEAIASAVKQHAPHAVRIGLESGQLSSWLFHELKEAGLPVICVDARHAKAALSLKVNKTDANDALGLAQIMRVGWYREVTVKGLDCQAERALLVARAQIVSQITTLKNCVRGILKTFGRVLPKGLRSQFSARVRAAIDGHPVLGAIIEPTLQVLEATRAQRQGRHSARSQRRHCPPADVGTGRRRGGCLGLYDRRRGSSAVQAIVVGGSVLRDDAQALSIRRGRSRRAYLQVRRRHGARPSIRGRQSVAQPVNATKRAEDLGRSP